MKHKILSIALTLLAISFLQIPAGAQILVPATLPDIPWYTSCGTPSYISGLNTAMIDYPASPLGNPPLPAGTLIVSDYNGNGTPGGVSFRDLASGFTITHQYCGTLNAMLTTPDIIVGNDLANPLSVYRVAAAYVDPATGDPRIDYYLLSYVAAGIFTPPVPIGTTTFAGFKTGTVHIDVIADYGNTTATGMPWCDKFVVVWDDAVTNNSYFYLGSLNAPIPGPVVIGAPAIALVNPGSGNAQPDVAGIIRTVGCAACHHPMGLFATTDVSNSNIYYQEYDFTAGLFTPPTLLDFAAYPKGITMPRIDAPDDFNINAVPLGIFPPSIYKVVTQTFFGGTLHSFTYDNTTGGTFLDDGTYLIPPGIQPFSPTVAYGGNGGTQYQVSHYVDAGGGPGSVPNIFMEPINWMTPATIPDFYFGSQLYYRVNTAAPLFANGTFLNAISTPCNNPSHLTLCSWADYDNSILASRVFYKATLYGGTTGYSFKQSPNAVPNMSSKNWAVYPNPATNALTIDNPNSDSRYQIMDILGRCQLKGKLANGRQVIDISDLLPGTYFVTIYNNSIEDGHTTFMKQ